MKYKCTVSYIGKNYDGFQSQRNGKSIQEVIEKAIQRITQTNTTITSSGRTDAGVNARAQVFMFESDKKLTPFKWMGAINGFLPDDIHITNIEIVPNTFHARFQVRRKTYCYRIHMGSYNVFEKDYILQIPYILDVDKMRECTKVFLGKHDFTSYNATPLSLKPDQTRTIEDIQIIEENNTLHMYFSGKGFLRYQVRMMAGALLDVGRGYKEISDIEQALNTKSKTVTRQNIASSGLTLENVAYYEMIGVDEHIQIRGFLLDDELPHETMTYSLLESMEVNQQPHRLYYVCTRHEQSLLGYVEIENDHMRIWLSDIQNKPLVMGIYDQILDWSKQNKIEEISILEIDADFYQNIQKMI